MYMTRKFWETRVSAFNLVVLLEYKVHIGCKWWSWVYGMGLDSGPRSKLSTLLSTSQRHHLSILHCNPLDLLIPSSTFQNKFLNMLAILSLKPIGIWPFLLLQRNFAQTVNKIVKTKANKIIYINKCFITDIFIDILISIIIIISSQLRKRT